MRIFMLILIGLTAMPAFATFKVELVGIAGFPAGGTTGQVLHKQSGTDYATEWTDDITSIGAVGSSPAAAGASVAAGVLTLQPADGTHPGVVTTGTQTIAGAKTLSTSVASPLVTGSTSVTTPNILFTIQASDPGTPVEGQMYFNSTSHVLKFYNGTVWKTVTTD